MDFVCRTSSVNSGTSSIIETVAWKKKKKRRQDGVFIYSEMFFFFFLHTKGVEDRDEEKFFRFSRLRVNDTTQR